MATPTRVVIDTDPGVDDMHALLLALGSPELVVEVRPAAACQPVCAGAEQAPAVQAVTIVMGNNTTTTT